MVDEGGTRFPDDWDSDDVEAAVNAAVAAAQQSGRTPKAHVMLVLLEHVRSEVPDMPYPTASAFQVADDFWRLQVGNPEDLLTSRVDCWKYLDAKNGNSAIVSGRGDHLTRAVICLLYPESPYDANGLYDTVDWFHWFRCGCP